MFIRVNMPHPEDVALVNELGIVPIPEYFENNLGQTEVQDLDGVNNVYVPQHSTNPPFLLLIPTATLQAKVIS